MSQKHDAESLEQANDWLTKRLQYTEQQVHEGEEVNTTLTEENRLLKEARQTLGGKVEDLTQELHHLRSSVHEYSYEKESLRNNIRALQQTVENHKTDEEVARQKADELQTEIEKVQEILSCNEQHIEDLRLYKEQLEERCSLLEHEKDLIKDQTSTVLHEKEQQLTEMQRQLNDMEASLHGQTSHGVGEESLSDILLADIDICDADTEHSSPVRALKQLELKLEKKDNSIQELEMRLESVKVANEIYEDQINDLHKKIDDSVVEMRHNSTCTDISGFSSLFDVECQTSPESADNSNPPPVDSQCQTDEASPPVTDVTLTGAGTGHDRSDILSEMLAQGDGIQHNMASGDAFSVLKVEEKQTSALDRPPATYSRAGTPLLTPEQCDAVVECYLLNDCSCEIVTPQSNTSGDVLQEGDADFKPVRTIETVCKICQQALRDADLVEGEEVGVQTDDIHTEESGETELSEMLSRLHGSVKTTSAAISELACKWRRTRLLHGVPVDTQQEEEGDNYDGNKSGSNNVSQEDVSLQSVQQLRKYGLVSESDLSVRDTHSISNLVYTLTLLFLIFILISMCALSEISAYGPGLRQVMLRINGRPSLPPF